MGSGCIKNSTNFSLKPSIPDTNVKYTGPAIPALGICTGDALSEIEAVVLAKIIDFSTGAGIEISNIDLTTCGLFVDDITCCNGSGSVPKDLDDLMGMIFTALCTLYTDFTALETVVTALLNGPYNIGCLPIATNSTLSQIVQSLITEFCLLKTRVTNLETAVTTLSTGLTTTIGNFLLTAITSCQSSGVTKSGSGATASIAFRGFTPIGGIIELASTISYAGMFDGTGLGISGTDMCGWALANGNSHVVNGVTVKTVDKRGVVGVGAINGMGGGSLPSYVVDGAASPSAAYSPGDIGGQIRHQLVAAEIPSVGVTGTVNDPGHDHGIQYQHQERKISNGGVDNYVDFSGAMTANTPWTEQPSGLLHAATPFSLDAGKVINNKTGITLDTLATAGGNGSHENRMPYTAALYIQRLY